MYNLIALLHVREGACEEIERRVAGLGAAVAPTMEGSFNGGDLIARFFLDDEAAYRTLRPNLDALIDGPDCVRADTAFYRPGKGQGGAGVEQDGPCIYRALLLCADRPVPPAQRSRFDEEMVLMPKYIPAIRNWRYSPVIEASGELGWTHVWEQEYDRVEDLLGPYMTHPYHWAHIDRWFDPESPDWLVNTRLCHSFGAFERPMI
ncbi:Dabb family protein [Pacificimonas sp. ICDLI1SI03]